MDRFGLDRDGDGLACEWGSYLRKTKLTVPKKVFKTRPNSYNRCYVGPRGGTYTLTSSGRKNYDGC